MRSVQPLRVARGFPVEDHTEWVVWMSSSRGQVHTETSQMLAEADRQVEIEDSADASFELCEALQPGLNHVAPGWVSVIESRTNERCIQSVQHRLIGAGILHRVKNMHTTSSRRQNGRAVILPRQIVLQGDAQ